MGSAPSSGEGPLDLGAAGVEMAREHLGLGRVLRSVTDGDSMWPRIRRGVVVLIAPDGGDAVGRGDVALVSQGETLVLHRVVRMRGDQLLLKGDANRQVDGWVEKKCVMGRVEPRLGDGLVAWLSMLPGRPITILAALRRRFFDRLGGRS